MADASVIELQRSMCVFEDDLEAMLNDWADAEHELVLRTGEVERRQSKQRLAFKHQPPSTVGSKPTVDDLDALVLDWLWDQHEDLMRAQLHAEAHVAAYKARYKCADRALSSKQSRLNADVKINLGSSR